MNDDRTLDARFWVLVKDNSKRTWICSLDEADTVRAWVEREGMGEVVTVTGSQFVAPGEIVQADVQAIEAGFHETMDAAMREWARPAPGLPMWARYGGRPSAWPRINSA